jgi:hypothetical protein
MGLSLVQEKRLGALCLEVGMSTDCYLSVTSFMYFCGRRLGLALRVLKNPEMLLNAEAQLPPL